MDSDESGHSESEFYYPEEETLNQMTPINRDEVEQDRHLKNIQDFIYSLRPNNTKKKTTYDLNIWRRFCSTVGEARALENIPPEELNILLCRFFMDVRKKNGGVYEPGLLASFQRSIQRYLNDHNCSTNVMKDQEFAKSREVLSARKRDLVVNNAKGNRPQAARELTEDEEDLLFQTNQFGEDDPEVLQRTVWWLLSLHFGFRARDECRRLQWGDIAVEDDPVSGKQVLEWKAERGSKTRQGDGHCRAFCPKAHATNTECCPVRPNEMKKPDAPFFQAINHSRAPDNPVWYSRAALGKNKIGEFLTKAAKNAGLPGNVTNHSVWKTCISRLMDAEVPVNYVAQLSGHKNLKSLDSYKTASDEHQRKMSLVFSSGKKKSPIFSNAVPVKPAVKAWELGPFKQQEKKKASLGEDQGFSGLFTGSNIRSIEGCTLNFFIQQCTLQQWRKHPSVKAAKTPRYYFR